MSNVLPFPSRGLEPEPESDRGPALREVIGDVLRDERQEQGRTLADVGKHAAVSLPYLSEVERGRKEASSEVLGAICDALELPLVDLVGRVAERLRLDARADGGPRCELLAA